MSLISRIRTLWRLSKQLDEPIDYIPTARSVQTALHNSQPGHKMAQIIKKRKDPIDEIVNEHDNPTV